MNISDEIKRLHDLHQAGALTDAEFEQAKAKLLAASVNLNQSAPSSGDSAPSSTASGSGLAAPVSAGASSSLAAGDASSRSATAGSASCSTT